MFVRIRFTIPFLISYIQLATRRFVLSFCGLIFFLFSFPSFPFSFSSRYMYISMYISINKVTCRRISPLRHSYLDLTSTSLGCMYIPVVDSSQPALLIPTLPEQVIIRDFGVWSNTYVDTS